MEPMSMQRMSMAGLRSYGSSLKGSVLQNRWVNVSVELGMSQNDAQTPFISFFGHPARKGSIIKAALDWESSWLLTPIETNLGMCGN